MHRVMVKAVGMVAVADAATVKAPDDAAADGACMNTGTSVDTCTNVPAGFDAPNVRAAKSADMTDTASDAGAVEPSDMADANATQPTDVSTTAEATTHTADMTAAEAASHTANVATAAEAAATTTARLCLRRK